MNFLKTLLASVAFIAAATSAHADVKNLGTLTDTHDEVKTVGANTSFDDFYNFVLTGTGADFSASKLVLTSKGVDRYNFSSLTFSVFSGIYGDAVTDVELYSTSVGVDQVEFTLGNLLAGNYFVKVAGVTSGASGGTYSFSITPVPEPSSVAMLLVGFAALGAVARRRKSL